ncbi:autotransporter assembly complex family protein [Phenylobacterium sp.]|uniref:autotransporter assembly complex protein TamA n=1 Tax=Phenylobacterium sp. TaxID=1871053 RepID=UPI002731FFBA|nr:autotransporter assembly complex family protein [Phenylobacterium sp.]MDP1615851.1 autotransporter assembly complex family protein [Phenylobacterium sp.]
MGRSVFAAVATAALCVYGAGTARAEPRADVRGDINSDLRERIVRAIGEAERPVDSLFQARRRARDAAEDAIAVLRSEAYYAYGVEADVGESEPPRPIVEVDPGPRFVFADPQVTWAGEAPDQETQARGVAAMEITPGEPGRSADVVAAEGRIVARVRESGYADVSADTREVIVDHADNTVRPTFRIDAGGLVRLDGLVLDTEGRTNPAWLDQLRPWDTGDIYDPEDVAELERRLLDTGVYNSVTVALSARDDVDEDGRRRVLVGLEDRAPRTLELGASYSTTEGFGVDTRWSRYNVLGRADTLALVGRVSELDSRLGADLTLPHWRRAAQTLHMNGGAYRNETDAFEEIGVGVGADLRRRYGANSFVTVGGSLDLTRNDEKDARTLSPLGRDLIIGAVFGAVSLDRSNDILDPTQGWRADLRLEPTYIAGDESLPYLEVATQGIAYLPLDSRGRTVMAGRLKVGSLVGGELPDIPASRRFYAGGGGSVRGYAYQAVGPRLYDNTPRGGLSLIEVSLEARRKLTDRWGVVAFVDAGSVGDEMTPTGENMSVGIGVGVRYDLGFGPIRADIAIPLDSDKRDGAFQVYLSIGQSF